MNIDNDWARGLDIKNTFDKNEDVWRCSAFVPQEVGDSIEMTGISASLERAMGDLKHQVLEQRRREQSKFLWPDFVPNESYHEGYIHCTLELGQDFRSTLKKCYKLSRGELDVTALEKIEYLWLYKAFLDTYSTLKELRKDIDADKLRAPVKSESDPKYLALKKDYADFIENTWQVFVAAQSKIGLWPEHEKQSQQLWKDKAKMLGVIP